MLERERRAIERRLAAAVAPNTGDPVLGRARTGYELAGRAKGVAHGGMGMVQALVGEVGLAAEIDASVRLLKVHHPYHESDHVLNVAYNALCGGSRLDDIELRRQDRAFLDGLGASALPDPTTAGDFCRRFDEDAVMALQDAVNRTRLRVWARQPASFTDETARIDADATIVGTDGCCKQGMDIASAPRGALTYLPRSGEGLEVISLGPMAHLDSKEEGDNSMPSIPALVPRRMGRGVGGPA